MCDGDSAKEPFTSHAESWNKIEVDGDPTKKDCLVR